MRRIGGRTSSPLLRRWLFSTKKLDTLAELKKENGELKKSLAKTDLVKLKKERNGLKEKNQDLRAVIFD